MICIGTFDVLKDTEIFVEGNDDDNRPKRREMRRLGLQVSFFLLLLFFCLLNDVHRYYGCSESTKGFSGGGATTMTTGPNDARHVVWALGEFFILFSLCFYFI